MTAALTPDSKIAPTIFLTFLGAASIACLAGIWQILIHRGSSTDAALAVFGCLLIFGVPLVLLLAEFRRFKSFLLTEKGVSFLSFVRKPAPRFVALASTYIEWSDVRRLALKGSVLHLYCDARRVGINLLWFKNASEVIAFVRNRTNAIPFDAGAPKP